MRIQKKNTILLDKVGMFISGLCAVHCSVLPLLLILGLGSGFGWMLSHEVELIFLVVSLTIASFSLLEGYIKIHRNLGAILLALIGFAFLVIGHEIEVYFLNIILSTIGGISILLAHFVNFRFRSRGVTLATNS